jgi:Mg-chelatase subunit ChlD
MTDDPGFERWRRWRLALGTDDGEGGHGLGERDRRIDAALTSLYEAQSGRARRGGLGRSAPRVARWLGDVRELFPTETVQVIQKDAFERLGLRQMLLEPEFLSAVEADIHLVAELVALRSVMPEKAKATARTVVRKVVNDIMEKLESRTVAALRGALDRARRARRPRFADIDWSRTIRANLHQYQPEHGTIAPERLIGRGRNARRSNLEDVILCVDESGSMASSVVYASIFAAVMASLPALRTQLVVFDTAVLDLTEELADPVEVLFGVQLGGGTDINQALGYCQTLVREPGKTHLILITDLFEGGDATEMLERATALVRSGVQLLVLLALSDDGKPASNEEIGRKLALLGCPVFGCTPELFPDLMAAALRRDNLHAWAASHDIAAMRGSTSG